MIYLQMIETSEDKSRFEKLYSKYHKLMLHVATKMLRNPEDAEDAVHLAFVNIAENISKIDCRDEKKVKCLVLTIVERRAVDLLRDREKHTTVSLEETQEGIETSYAGENKLAKCILRLPTRYREIIILKYWNGYSIHEIAKFLNLSLANTAKIDQRAKKKLEQLCKEEGLL